MTFRYSDTCINKRRVFYCWISSWPVS